MFQSTLLQCLLGELKPLDGKVEVRGRLSYVSQEPWMFMGTIRDNILFGMSYDSAWYNKVIEACSLDEVATAMTVSFNLLIISSKMHRTLGSCLMET